MEIMKKVLLAFIPLVLFIDVQAVSSTYNANECNPGVIKTGLSDLEDVTYSLSYADWVIDHESNPLEGYFELTVANLPEGYKIIIETSGDGFYSIEGQIDYAVLQGGVYTLKYYNSACDTVIKAANIKVPFYKTYCGVNVDCKDNPWFDGTYENSASNQNRPNKNKLSTALVVILVILILIIAGFVAVILKRRHDNAKKL